jgi:hypothetical protein
MIGLRLARGFRAAGLAGLVAFLAFRFGLAMASSF